MHLSLPLGAISFAGYSALIERYQLAVPLPDRLFTLRIKCSMRLLGVY